MKLTTKGRYAVMAMADIALYQNGKHNYSLDLAEKIINNKKNNHEKNTDYLDSKKTIIDIKKLMTIRDSLSKLL